MLVGFEERGLASQASKASKASKFKSFLDARRLVWLALLIRHEPNNTGMFDLPITLTISASLASSAVQLRSCSYPKYIWSVRIEGDHTA